VFVAVENPVLEIGSSDWNTRAWTYQEALLSRRRLVFTDRQVYFQCRLGHRIEGLDFANRVGSTRALRAFPERGIGFRTVEIYDRLEEYYGRKLSFNADILNAFSGIFRAFQKSPFGLMSPYATHFYGIPIIVPPDKPSHNLNTSFAAGLAWQVTVHNDVSTVGTTTVSSSSYPSWTWAAFKADRPSTDPGQLLLLHRGSSRLPKLDDILEIEFCHQSGAEMSLSDYVKHGDDYTSFLPQVRITSMTMPGILQQDQSGFVTFSTCPQMALHLDKKPTQVSCNAVAIYVGYMVEKIKVSLAFILVELLESGDCRRLGIISHRVNSYHFDGNCQRVDGVAYRYHDFDTRNTGRDFSLQSVCGGGEWHKRTLVLV
jgi:hypothetical protein